MDAFDPNVTNKNIHQANEDLIGDGLGFSDYFDDSIPYDVKPVPFLQPMDELDYPIQAKDIFADLSKENLQTQLKMSPLLKETDSVEWRGKLYNWERDSVAVFLYYPKTGTYVASVFDLFFTPEVYSNRDDLENKIRTYLKSINNVYGDIRTHMDLETIVERVVGDKIGDNILQGRIFKINDPNIHYIFGFWESSDVIRPFKKPIVNFLTRIGLNPKKILWTHSDGLEVITFDELFGGGADRAKRSKEQLELLKQIHLNTTLKRYVLKLPPHPFQLLADNLGITVSQLRQIAGKAIAEEKQLVCEDIINEVQRGEGFWLDSQGVFHNVDVELGATGHLNWAKRFFKRPMKYEEVMDMGFIWVGVDKDTINYLYTIPPSPTQLYLLKKTAADDGFNLKDLRHKVNISVDNFRGRGRMDETIVEVEDARDKYNKFVDWRDAQSIFTIYRRGAWCLLTRIGTKINYMCSNKKLEKVLNAHDEFQYNFAGGINDADYARTHYGLFRNIIGAQKKHLKHRDHMLDNKVDIYHGIISSRIFVMNGGEKTVVGFWQDVDQVRDNWNEIENILNMADIDYEHAKYTFQNRSIEHSYTIVTGKTPIAKVDPKTVELMKLIHLSPEAKKALIKRGHDYLQKLSDNMGISVVQLRQMLGSLDENIDYSVNATLIWLEKDGTIHDTNDTQHGIYVADNPNMFGVNPNFAKKIFDRYGDNGIDDAAAIMCEQAFRKGWLRIVKVPWNNKIFVEGNDPTKAQKQVLEDWYFEDKSKTIIWQRWVSSKFGPPRPIILFPPETINEVENVYPKGTSNGYQWDDPEAICVFLIYDTFSVWTNKDGVPKFFSTDKELRDNLNDKFAYDPPKSHTRLKYMMGKVEDDENKYSERSANVEGRVFNTPDGVFVGFWQNFNVVKPHWYDVEKILKSLGYNPSKCKYTFGANGWDQYSYNYIMDKNDGNTKVTSDVDLKLRKIMHLNAQAKKALLHLPPNRLQFVADKFGITTIQLKRLLGRDIAEEGKINEDPDAIAIKTKNTFTPIILSYDSDNVVAVVCIGKIEFENHNGLGWIGGSPYASKLFYNRKPYRIKYGGETHHELLAAFEDRYAVDKLLTSSTFRYKRGIHYRLYRYRRTYYAAFWESRSQCKKYIKQIQDSLDFFTKGQLDKVMCQFEEQSNDEYVSFEKAFSSSIKRTRSKEQARIAQQIHLMAPERKAAFLKAMGAGGLDRVQLAADKMGMTAAELRQALGMSVAEQLIKESPDSITIKRGEKSPERAYYDDQTSLGPFCCGHFYGERDWAYYLRSNGLVVRGDEILLDIGTGNILTHGGLLSSVFGDERDDEDYKRGCHGRLFKIGGQHYVSFWENKDILIKWKKEIEECLSSMGADPKNVYYQTVDMFDDAFDDYYEMFNAKNPSKNSRSEEDVKRAEQLHLLPPAKKAELLKLMGAAKPDKIKLAADKMGMTVTQLHQILGRTDEDSHIYKE
jgi:hypothetical protein